MVTLKSGDSLDDYARAFELQVGDGEPRIIATGEGQPDMVIALEQRVAAQRLVRQTGEASAWWSIAEVDVGCAQRTAKVGRAAVAAQSPR